MIPEDWREIPAEFIEKGRESARHASLFGREQGQIGHFAGIPVYHQDGRWYVSTHDMRQYGKSKGLYTQRPEHPTQGQVFVDTETNTTHRFDGVQWKVILASRWPDLDIQEVPDDVSDEEALLTEAEHAERRCIWCGEEQESVEALALHEETCE